MSATTGVSAAVTIAVTALMAGVFYTFSISVMPGLDQTEAEHAIPAFQNINRAIENPLFFATFFAVPVGSVVTGALLLAAGQRPAAWLFFAAGAVYVLGSALPTMLVNVPMNTALDVVQVPADPGEAARIWSDHASRWVPWNHLRGVSATISVLLVSLGVFVWGSQR
jgi:uncharacterized membrane protein